MLIFSDIHLHHFKSDIGEVSRIKYTLQAVKDVIDYAKKYNEKNIIFLGDWFHNRDNIKPDLLIASYKILELLDKDMTLYMIPGNHDYSSINNLQVFNGISNIKIIENIEVMEIEQHKIVFVPFAKQKEFFKQIDTYSLLDYVMGHLSISPYIKGGYSRKKLKDFKLVISGHHHDRIIDNNILYIGSLVPVYPTEEMQKYFLLLYEKGHAPKYKFIEMTSRIILKKVPAIKPRTKAKEIAEEITPERQIKELKDILFNYVKDKNLSQNLFNMFWEEMIKEESNDNI